jgi:hypothetical protein
MCGTKVASDKWLSTSTTIFQNTEVYFLDFYAYNLEILPSRVKDLFPLSHNFSSWWIFIKIGYDQHATRGHWTKENLISYHQ